MVDPNASASGQFVPPTGGRYASASPFESIGVPFDLSRSLASCLPTLPGWHPPQLCACHIALAASSPGVERRVAGRDADVPRHRGLYGPFPVHRERPPVPVVGKGEKTMTLRDDVSTYLEADDYSVTERPYGLLVGVREALGGYETIYVWVPSTRHGIPEQTLMSEFGAAGKDDPGARKFMLVESMEGISTEFRSDANRYFRVQVRTPAQFFDTRFRDEDARDAATSMRRLRDRGRDRLHTRIQQPYFEYGTDSRGDDLLPVLSRSLRDRGRNPKPLNLVIGPGGIGKTYLFEALFATLYDDFQSAKRSLTPSRRPLPLLPGHLPLARDYTLNGILDAFLKAEFSRPLSEKTFSWMLLHGFGTWLIDGLDEVIARDTGGLFDWLLDLMTAPEAPTSPAVLICVRDSVYSANADFREFVGDLSEYTRIYHLEEWSSRQIREFANRRLDDRTHEFEEVLGQNQVLGRLVAVPYYCDLLVSEFDDHRVTSATSEEELLELALERILEREKQKGLLDERFVEDEDVRDLLELVAAQNMSGGYSGVDIDFVREWAQVVTPEDMPPEDRERVTINVGHLALFAGSEGGYLRFAQELLEQYLLGRYFVEACDRSRENFVSDLGKARIPPDWLTMRMLANHVRKGDLVGQLGALAYENLHGHDVAVRNLIQTVALASDEADIFHRFGFAFEQLNLSGIRFAGIDLAGMSLAGCNLTDTEFIGCWLQDAELMGAILRNTRFDEETAGNLEGADVGDLSTFYSIRIGSGEVIADLEEAQQWFAKRTARRVESVGPCAAAKQLRHMFGKYVYPTGEARRSSLDSKAIVSGTRYVTDPEELVEALRRHGYLVGTLGGYDRPGGDKYSDMVAYSKMLSLPPGLIRVLNDVCEEEGCEHVPRRR